MGYREDVEEDWKEWAKENEGEEIFGPVGEIPPDVDLDEIRRNLEQQVARVPNCRQAGLSATMMATFAAVASFAMGYMVGTKESPILFAAMSVLFLVLLRATFNVAHAVWHAGEAHEMVSWFGKFVDFFIEVFDREEDE